MKFSVTLTFTNPDYWLELAQLAESHGYDTMVLSDHLVHHETISARYPYNETGSAPGRRRRPGRTCGSPAA